MDNKTPDTLYHYCSLDTFLKIIKNKTIWLSDILKSNDFDEITWAKRMLRYKIVTVTRDYISNHPDCDNEKVWELSRACQEIIFDKTSRFWTFCLSEESDLLSQWRGYADDGQGISIGFKRELFDFLSVLPLAGIKKKNTDINFRKINYSIDAIERWFAEEKMFDDCYQAKNIEELQNALFKAMFAVEEAAVYYKNDAFYEEKEWRLVLSVNDRETTINSFSELNTPKMSFSNVEYTVIRQQLISHVELRMDALKDFILEIVVGPKCRSSIDEIRLVLYTYGFLESISDEKIRIARSKASYR